MLPVPGHAVLLVQGPRPLLVVADLHLGLARHDPQGPRTASGSAGELAKEILEVAERTGARRLLLVGDVKDPIPGTPRHVGAQVLDFFERLREGGLSSEVVLGNHDVGLTRYLPPEVAVHPASGWMEDGVGYFHGHAWPSARILRQARVLVAGHLHPGFRLAPTAEAGVTGKHRCWVRGELRPLTRAERRRQRKHPLPRAGSMIILPAFNPLCANTALNREEPQRGRRFLVRRFLARGEARAYLLDGTDLGPIAWSARS